MSVLRVGILTGSGTYALPGFEGEARAVDTPYGTIEATVGAFAGVEAVHVSRHGAGHLRLSSAVNHRANLWAMRELGAGAVVGCTACGATDTAVGLGDLVVFDDLHFPVNRLPTGELCTYFLEGGEERRGHWILHGGPFSAEVRAALLAGARETGHTAHDGGTYGHVDGPRFNTPSEIAQLRAAGVTAVSQTGGCETTLAGELELPFALVGFATDYANEVKPGDTTPVEVLIELMGRSTGIFAAVLTDALPRLVTGPPPQPAGTFYPFG